MEGDATATTTTTEAEHVMKRGVVVGNKDGGHTARDTDCTAASSKDSGRIAATSKDTDRTAASSKGTCCTASTNKDGEQSSNKNGGQGGDDKDGEQTLKENHLCTCWCVGYSEVYVRQPTGNMVWMMRLQNHQQILEEGKHVSLDDLASLYGPNITPKIGQLGQVRSH